LLGFQYNGGLYDGSNAGPFEIAPYPVEITSKGWRSHGGSGGGFIFTGLGSSMRIDVVEVVVNSLLPDANNPVVDVTIGGQTQRLDASTEATPAEHVGRWTSPTVGGSELAIDWTSPDPGDIDFEFVVLRIDYTLVGPYLLSVNTGLPVENGATNVQMEGRNFKTATAITINGVSQTLINQGRQDLRFSLVRGGSKYGTQTMIVTDGSHSSSASVSLAPQAGWNMVNISGLYGDASLRVEASPDIVDGDQVAYSTQSDELLVNPDGTFVYYGAMPASIPAEVWNGGNWQAGTIELEAGSGNEDL
jgi:hypothetical protein